MAPPTCSAVRRSFRARKPPGLGFEGQEKMLARRDINHRELRTERPAHSISWARVRKPAAPEVLMSHYRKKLIIGPFPLARVS